MLRSRHARCLWHFVGSFGKFLHDVQPRPYRVTITSLPHLKRSIVLVGLMGAGKTSLGRRLAQRLHVPFADSDAEIEKAANETIAEIFARDGEPAFRVGERRIIARLLEGPVQVLATGGGAFMDPLTRAGIREHGLSVWIRADLETLLDRTARRQHRPLLNVGDPREIMTRLMAIRHPIYAEADITIDSIAGPPEAMVQKLLAALADWTDANGAIDRPSHSRSAS
jgi:shikimate kinase